MTLVRSKRFILISLILLALAAVATPVTSGTAATAQRGGEFMIVNKSSYSIYHLYLSPSIRRAWGKDQLGRRVIKPGDSFTLHGIPCGLYDIKVVDQDGDACEIREIAMCKDHTHWDMTNDDLLRCEGFSE
ncbi:MAG TPA: hypothetical protein VF791_16470 [Pyrinomonadaceae bacterium]